MSAAKSFPFGLHRIRASEIFFASRYSFGLVNLKPLVPRVVPRFHDLTPDEVADMFQSAQTIARVLEREYKGVAMTVAMQDGALAGQTVPHCHVHLIPRRQGDWPNNDDIYRDLDRGTRDNIVEDLTRPPRTLEDMAAEATMLRKLFPDNNVIE
ncbi:tumor suppressor protein [Thamnocephalis sphaerospora]|uniref:Tumor suppressor protein n=1 Tax=Thamnocephalis sphaerospora TaxID=78915 RepID=A0A4P9XMP3_9FUNG|nr:tumor suppressor protein [Thamnocephalis sphaerospora]|eukprot:RKP07156.1 tumor suppressor protein [Thamnocephalis sphaerospora]